MCGNIVIRSIAIVAFLASASAQANLLTNADFESNDFYGLLNVPNQWGGEFNSSLVGANNGITPYGSQMLRIGDAGGGTAAQVAQQVTGSFTAGSTVNFNVQLNANGAGALAFIRLHLGGGWGSAPTPQISMLLDSNASTWQNLALSAILDFDVTSIFAEIWTPIVSGAGVGYFVEYPNQYVYADNAVLTVTSASVPAPPALPLLLLGLLGMRIVGRRKAQSENLAQH